MNILLRFFSNDLLLLMVVGRLWFWLENDGDWWKLFDFILFWEEFEKILISLGIFKSFWFYRDFIESNLLMMIVCELWWNCKGYFVFVFDWISFGFVCLMDVLIGWDYFCCVLIFVMILILLCLMLFEKLKIMLGE